MTREELIEHLEHLEKYTHYSEDAPALREAIEMLKCSEMPNSSDERTETHACDLPQSTMGQVNDTVQSTMGQVNDTVQSTNDCISRQAAIDIVVFECDKWTGLAKEISKQLRQLPPVQPDHIVEVGKKVGDDLISRQAAKLKVARVIWKDGDSYDDFQDKCVDCLDDVPSAQPESNDDAEFWRKRAEFYEKTCFDLIANMSDGVKIDSIIIDENGIKFTKKQPDRKSVNGRKEISGGIDGTALVRG